MAQSHDSSAIKQHGNWKNLSALQQAMNVRLTMDLLSLTRKPMSILAIDFCSCCDGMQHTIVSLAMWKHRHEKTPTMCQFVASQEMHITLRIVHGDSELHNVNEFWMVPLDINGNPTLKPPQGVGQGSLDGPILWAIVSTAVLRSSSDA